MQLCKLLVQVCKVVPECPGMRCPIIATINMYLVIYMELHSSKGKGDRGKRTSDHARTRDLCSIAEFQPSEPRRPVEIPRPPSLLCTGYRCAAIQRHLNLRLEAGTECYVMVAGSAVPSTLHEFASLGWKATSISLYVQWVFVSWYNI